MGSDSVVIPPVSPLQELCGRAKLGDEAQALLAGDCSTKQFLALLVEKEMFRDAIRLVAYLLPRREAIGWGCLCEENRWAAKEAADREDPKTPSGLLAMAVFFAGPSMAPPNLQAVPPPDHVTSEVVAGAIVLAGVVQEPEKAKEKYRVFMQKASALITRMQQPQT